MRKSQTKSKKLARSRSSRVEAEIRAGSRRKAIKQASQILRELGIEHERGDSLVIVPRFKLMFAFDSGDLLEGIEAHAKTSGSDLVHISEELFHETKMFRGVILQELRERKPVYYAGNSSRTRTNKNLTVS